MFKIKNPTLGSDFEMLVQRIDNNQIVPCPIQYGGTKKEPLSIDQGCSRQIDGVAAEANTPVCSTLQEWRDAFGHCIKMSNRILLPLGVEVIAKAYHYFDASQLTEPRHLEFGCSASYDAYTWNLVEPTAEMAGTMRTTGTHIHVGFDLEEGLTEKEMSRFIMCMDKCVGIPSLDYDTNTERRKLYGKAGEFRYRVIDELEIMIMEYRVLSGAMLTPEGIDFMWGATHEAINLFNSGYQFTKEEIAKQVNLINHTAKVEV